ncbi:hypothetical protein MMU07_14330 [Aquiflexum sp. LQ15W]|uniref:hypothetical protein n=1 Tax=Cognataquiflexum nitidum TaxID=2922272 RepID=UPI001F12CCD0|nr:hypothetical protein [Cognataquiflexum nitidum]MCH6200759.1 hypothetical protein [Cognataquiflexum nitidum]
MDFKHFGENKITYRVAEIGIYCYIITTSGMKKKYIIYTSSKPFKEKNMIWRLTINKNLKKGFSQNSNAKWKD